MNLKAFHLLIIPFFGLLLNNHAQAQEIEVENKSTEERIEDVFIYHESGEFTAITDEKGEADLSDFPKNGTYIFQHPAFLTRRFDYEELKDLDFEITMKEKILQIDEVTVTANRWEQQKENVSQDILAISSKKAVFQNTPTSADLLEATGQVYVQKSQLGGGSPMLRGFAANSVLLVVDGVRLNNAIYRSGNLQNIIGIDPNALEGAEVIFGPGSVMYGSDALGGVMDFHTSKLRFTTLKDPQFAAQTFTRYASASNERTGHADLTFTGKKVSYFGSVTYSSFDDLRAGRKKTSGYKGEFEREFYVETFNGSDFLVRNPDEELQVGSGYNLFNSVNKIKLKTGSQSDLTYGFYYSTTSDIPRYDQLTEKIPGTDSLVYAEWYYGPQTWTMHALTYNWYKPNRLFNKSKFTAAYQDYSESRNDRIFESPDLRTRKENVDLYSLSLDFDKELNRSSLFYGLDFIYNDINSEAQIRNVFTEETAMARSRYPDGGSQYITTALYANYVFKQSSKWTYNAGIRFSDVRLEGKTEEQSALQLRQNEISLDNQAVNGMVGAIYKLNEDLNLNALISTGFRAPNLDDVGKLFEVNSQIVTVPNPDLKPEYSYNQEIGITQNSGNFRLGAVLYYSLLDNAIVRGNFSLNGQDSVILDGENKAVRAQVNAGRARIYGASLNAAAQFDPTWAATASLTYSDGYEIDTNEPLRHIPPVFGRMAVIYKEKRVRLELSSNYNFNKPADDIPDSEIIDKAHLYTEEGIPGWITLNFRGQYIFGDHITGQLGIDNIMDQHYRTYSSGISAPGRNVIIGIRGKF